jgi:hypothetical protein
MLTDTTFWIDLLGERARRQTNLNNGATSASIALWQ